MSMKLQYRRTEEDIGTGSVILKWRPNAHSLAVACPNNSVIYYDKKGNIIDALDMTGPVVDIAWDKEGDVLAVASTNSSSITLWDVNSRATDIVESGATSSKELPTCLCWSPASSNLVVGNNAGNLLVYNHRTSRKVSFMGKHQRSVTFVKISTDDQIISCSDDNTMSVSTIDGKTICSTTVSGEPTDLDIGIVSRSGVPTQTMISCLLGKKILMIAAIDSLDNPVNLQFQERYGNIVSYSWFNDGYLAIGFDKGFLVSISAHQSELGSEICSIGEYKTYLGAVTTSQSLSKVLSVGDNQIKIREMNQLTELYTMTEVDTDKELCDVKVSDDGQLLAVASQSGSLNVFVTKMPSLAAAFNNTIAYLTGLTQVTIISDLDKKQTATIEIGVEPSLMGIGPNNLAIATNNLVFFYDYSFSNIQSFQSNEKVQEPDPINRVEYLSTVTNVQLNSFYAAVSTGTKLRLHRIRNSDENVSIIFPEPSRNARLLSSSLTENFLIFSTDTNYIVYFSLEEWSIVSEYRHVVPFRSIFPHPNNVICCCFDDRIETLIYSAVDDGILKLPAVGSTVHYKGALWETFVIDKDTFAVYDNNTIYVFLMTKRRIEGESVVYVGSTKLPFGHIPLALNKGIVKCLIPSGKISSVLLNSHKTDSVLENKNQAQIGELLNKALLMQRWSQAWRICEYSKQLSHWNMFAHAALLDSDVTMAIRIFRHIGDVAMVAALEQIENIEEKNLLSAQVAVILGRYDEAEQLFLLSSKSIEALNMRRDLLEWPKALILAEKMAPNEIPFISKEYAQQLELMGDHANALENYEKGVIENNDNPELQEHNEICQSGIARMSIKTGDLRKGIQLAKQLEGRVVKRDCAIILEQLKQYTEAAQLYEIGLFYDRAAAVCLKANAWGKVGELLQHVKSPKIHIQYGKIMEAEKKFKQAAMCYERGRDYDNLVRVLLDPLNMPEEAVRVVRESRSIEGAKLVAKFFSRLGDHSSAIQFLVMSQCVQEAFDLAEKNDSISDYANAIEQFGTNEQAIELAEYYLSIGDLLNAARFHIKGGQYQLAMQLLIRLGDRQESVEMSVDCAIKSNDKDLIQKLIHFLIGQNDGIPKDPNHLFKLYVGLGMVKEAAKTAVIVSQTHQNRGSYRIARDVLFQMYLKLNEQKLKIPSDMQKSLMIVHSYMIVKPLMARKEHLKAARMMVRTCDHISRFQAHVVQILTSAVVICTLANLKKSAHKWATMLMNPDYRPKIHEKYKKKIEDIVRRGGNESDQVEDKSACPFCDHQIDETCLVCDNCKNNIPFCILTGKHIVSSDFSKCSTCQMPAFFSEFKKLAAIGEKCYMCGGDAGEVIPGDAKAYLEQF